VNPFFQNVYIFANQCPWEYRKLCENFLIGGCKTQKSVLGIVEKLKKFVEFLSRGLKIALLNGFLVRVFFKK
jgi:hypothetical protein